MEIKIVHEHGHYVAYVNGKFYCTADTYAEAAKEVNKMEAYENV